MSDTTPMAPPSAPPSYTESKPNVNHSDNTEAPPPYSPPNTTYTYHHVIDNSNTGYQRFDNLIGCQIETVALISLGPDPCQVQCSSCGQVVITDTDHKAGTLTFITAALCFLFCIVCTFLPFCIDDLQDVSHYCPRCKHYLGTYSRI